MTELTEQQQKEMEQSIINMLLNRGIEIKVPRRSALSYFFKTKERTLVIREAYAGTLDLLTDQFLKLEIDETTLKENPILEADKVVKKNRRITARIAAIAWLNGRCYVPVIPLMWGFYNWPLIWLVTNYFDLRLKPSVLLQLSKVIRQLMNTADFVNSIRLLTAVPRTTKPKADLVEEEVVHKG